jgi:hypothetical protein
VRKSQDTKAETTSVVPTAAEALASSGFEGEEPEPEFKDKESEDGEE